MTRSGRLPGGHGRLEGEPAFVPVQADGTAGPDTIPIRLDMPVGRVVRFHDAVAPRSYAPAIGVFVTGIRALVGGAVEVFSTGDSIIGAPVSLGPATYFAANHRRRPIETTVPAPEETADAGRERLANFEFHMGEFLSGSSLVGPFQGIGIPRNPDDRPVTSDLQAISGDMEDYILLGPDGQPVITPGGQLVFDRDIDVPEFGVMALNEFNRVRRAALQSDLDAMSPGDRTGTPEGRNLTKRIAHLDGIFSRTLYFGYYGKEEYLGLINDDIAVDVGNSIVMAMFAGFSSYDFFARFFNFHSDELCGQVSGSVSVTGI